MRYGNKDSKTRDKIVRIDQEKNILSYDEWQIGRQQEANKGFKQMSDKIITVLQ